MEVLYYEYSTKYAVSMTKEQHTEYTLLMEEICIILLKLLRCGN